MNKFVKSGLIFLAGTTVGGGVSYFICNKILSKKYNKIAEKEISDARKMYEDRIHAELTNINDAAREKIEKTVLAHDKPPIDTIAADYIEKAEEAAKTGDYVDESNVPEYDKSEHKKAPVTNSRKLNGRISSITMDDFLDVEPRYDKCYYTIYKDDIIADDMDVVVEPYRFGAYVEEIKDHIARSGGKAGYFRNDELETDFEICTDYRDYFTAVGRHPY